MRKDFQHIKLSYTLISERTIIFYLKQNWSFESPQENTKVWLNKNEGTLAIIFQFSSVVSDSLQPHE